LTRQFWRQNEFFFFSFIPAPSDQDFFRPEFYPGKAVVAGNEKAEVAAILDYDPDQNIDILAGYFGDLAVKSGTAVAVKSGTLTADQMIFGLEQFVDRYIEHHGETFLNGENLVVGKFDHFVHIIFFDDFIFAPVLALLALLRQDIFSLFQLDVNRLHQTAAGSGSVAGVDVDVLAP
jgi:hypothetical protein